MAEKQQRVVFAASAVVWRAGKVLLVRRGRPPGKDFWSLPGGKIEPGETPEAAALREVQEETGLLPEFCSLIRVFTVAAGDVEYQISCFAGQSEEGEIIAGDDAAEARWLEISELAEFNLAPNTLNAIQHSQQFIKP